MKKVIYYLVYIIAFFLSSCASVSVISTEKNQLVPSGVFVILPFVNNTESPLAGQRVAYIAEGVAASKGYKLRFDIYKPEAKEYTYEDIEKVIEQLRNRNENIDYVITGSVNEFRYKTGIDGEPAVSITLRIYDLKNNKVILTNTGSKTGWANESIGTVVHKILISIMP